MLSCLSTSFPVAGQVAFGPEQPGMSPVCSQNASDKASNPYLKWEMYWNQINQTGTDLNNSLQSIRLHIQFERKPIIANINQLPLI